MIRYLSKSFSNGASHPPTFVTKYGQRALKTPCCTITLIPDPYLSARRRHHPVTGGAGTNSPQ